MSKRFEKAVVRDFLNMAQESLGPNHSEDLDRILSQLCINRGITGFANETVVLATLPAPLTPFGLERLAYLEKELEEKALYFEAIKSGYSDRITSLVIEKKGLVEAYQHKTAEDAKRFDELHEHNQKLTAEIRRANDTIEKLNSQIFVANRRNERMEVEINQLRFVPITAKIFTTPRSKHSLADLLSQVEKPHDSDCATHNMPAYVNGACDCRIKGNDVAEDSHKNDSIYQFVKGIQAQESAKREAMAKKDDAARAMLAVKRENTQTTAPQENLVSFKDGSYKKVKFVSWKHSQWIHYATTSGKNLRINPENVNYIEEI